MKTFELSKICNHEGWSLSIWYAELQNTTDQWNYETVITRSLMGVRLNSQNGNLSGPDHGSEFQWWKEGKNNVHNCSEMDQAASNCICCTCGDIRSINVSSFLKIIVAFASAATWTAADWIRATFQPRVTVPCTTDSCWSYSYQSEVWSGTVQSLKLRWWFVGH